MVEGVYEGEDHPNPDDDVKDRENFAFICLWCEITKADGSQCDKRKIEGIQVAPSLQVMIGKRANNQDNGHRQKQVSVFFIL